MLFRSGEVFPPRLEQGETLTAALVATFSSRTTFTKRLSDLQLLKALFMRMFVGAENLTDFQICTGVKKITRVIRVA